jgi:hypothetical protein
MLLRFPSLEAAAQFRREAMKKGIRTAFPEGTAADLFPGRLLLWMLLGALAGAIVGSVAGAVGEGLLAGLPRLEPLFAAPHGAVTLLALVTLGCIGAVVPALVLLPRTRPRRYPNMGDLIVLGEPDAMALQVLRNRWHGTVVSGDGVPPSIAVSTGTPEPSPFRPTPLRWLAWATAVVVGAVLLTALAYIWLLSAAYGPGADQESRIGYTMKNAQRIPGETAEEAALSIAGMLGGERLEAPADPLAAAVMAPVAAARNETLVYGAGPPADLEAAALDGLAALPDAKAIVLVAETEPAYALPAAYMAARFGLPVVPVGADGPSSALAAALAGSPDRLLLVAAPSRLVSDRALDGLRRNATVERVADENYARHAVLWSRARWGAIGWGIDEQTQRDGYFYFTLANPGTPGFAAAGLPMAYRSNSGPLLYTGHDDLADTTDRYLWRLSPDFYAAPSDGPFANVRVLGPAGAVGYNAQARADLALETHQYLNQVTGMSGLAALVWSWIIVGLFGALWALVAMDALLPETGFHLRLVWPLAMIVLGPLGIALFVASYQGRPIAIDAERPRFLRPPWLQAASATIMGVGMGIPLMIASMYVVELRGMPLTTAFASTPLWFLGGPMTTVMWLVMVVPAIAVATLGFAGPMMAERHRTGYLDGVRRAFPTVAVSMLVASVGMWTTAWFVMSFPALRSPEDLWFWVVPLWLSALGGYLPRTSRTPGWSATAGGWGGCRMRPLLTLGAVAC